MNTNIPLAHPKTEAEKFQQRGERRRGYEAVQCFQQAAVKFQSVIQSPATDSSPSDQHIAAWFGLGETLQTWAQASLDAAAALPDNTPNLGVIEKTTQREAIDLLRRSIEAYKQVTTSPATMRVDAAVNCGNALSSLAELLEDTDQSQAAQLLSQACDCYSTALQQEENDASTINNLADALTQLAAITTDDAERQSQIFQQAMNTYERACSVSSSENGDDLPSLLMNWGSALTTAAKHAPSYDIAIGRVEEAVLRLKNSILFDRADTDPLNALGDAYLAKAELLASSLIERQGGDVDVQKAAEAALKAYEASLGINRTNAEAILGCADVYMFIARFLQQQQQQHMMEEVKEMWARAEQLLSSTTMANPTGIGGFSDRCDVRYNHACALARIGRVEEAAAVLRGLIQMGVGSVVEDVGRDEDLESVRGLLLV
jgi:tetratricopeptide (TPR) repeat protein